jgi:hypothetical protein
MRRPAKGGNFPREKHLDVRDYDIVADEFDGDDAAGRFLSRLVQAAETADGKLPEELVVVQVDLAGVDGNGTGGRSRAPARSRKKGRVVDDRRGGCARERAGFEDDSVAVTKTLVAKDGAGLQPSGSAHARDQKHPEIVGLWNAKHPRNSGKNLVATVGKRITALYSCGSLGDAGEKGYKLCHGDALNGRWQFSGFRGFGMEG